MSDDVTETLLRYYSRREWTELGSNPWDECLGCSGASSANCAECLGYKSARQLVLATSVARMRECHRLLPSIHALPVDNKIRCIECGHPKKKGSWLRNGVQCPGPASIEAAERGAIRCKFIENGFTSTYLSKCDHGCTHDPVSGGRASWRLVDARRLSWEHDLRAWETAVLCTRCFAEYAPKPPT